MSHLAPAQSPNASAMASKAKKKNCLVRQRLMLAMGFPVDQPLYEQLERAVGSSA